MELDHSPQVHIVKSFLYWQTPCFCCNIPTHLPTTVRVNQVRHYLRAHVHQRTHSPGATPEFLVLVVMRVPNGKSGGWRTRDLVQFFSPPWYWHLLSLRKNIRECHVRKQACIDQNLHLNYSSLFSTLSCKLSFVYELKTEWEAYVRERPSWGPPFERGKVG